MSRLLVLDPDRCYQIVYRMIAAQNNLECLCPADRRATAEIAKPYYFDHEPLDISTIIISAEYETLCRDQRQDGVTTELEFLLCLFGPSLLQETRIVIVGRESKWHRDYRNTWRRWQKAFPSSVYVRLYPLENFIARLTAAIIG